MKRCPNCNFPNIDSDNICFKCGSKLVEESPIPEALSMPTNEAAEVPKATPNPQTLHSNQPTQDHQALHNHTTSQVQSTLHTPPSTQPKTSGNIEDLIPKPNPVFDTNKNISAFIHKPTDTTQMSSKSIETTSQTPLSSKGPLTNSKASSEVAATSMPLPKMPVPPLATSSPSLPTPARILPKYKSLKRLKTLSKCIGLLFGLALIALGILLIFVYPGLLGIVSCIGFSGMGVIFIFLGFVLASVLGWLNDVECNQRKQIELINHIYHKIED